jgi:ankyrin repeat protein
LQIAFSFKHFCSFSLLRPCHSLPRLLFPVLFFFLVFGAFFKSSLTKAQIADFISEDGDGIMGITSLMNAAINDDIQAVEFFASAGEAVVNQRNIGGAAALHIAARNNNLEVAKILISSGADINLTDNEGWTPLMRAASFGNVEMARFLLNEGANAAWLNKSQETAIIHSASIACFECLELMLSRYDFVKNLNIDVLKKQIAAAMKIARNKNDSASYDILLAYLKEEVSKSSAYSITNNFALKNKKQKRTTVTNPAPSVQIRSLSANSQLPLLNNGGVNYKFNKLSVANPQSATFILLGKDSARKSKRSAKKPQDINYNINKLDEKINRKAAIKQPIKQILKRKIVRSKRFVFKGQKARISDYDGLVKNNGRSYIFKIKKPARQTQRIVKKASKIHGKKYRFTGKKKKFILNKSY